MVKKLSRKERVKRDLLKVGEIADRAGVLRSTICYYADIGLLKVEDYTQGKYRLFKKDETLVRIAKIKELKAKGLPLDEIKKELGG